VYGWQGAQDDPSIVGTQDSAASDQASQGASGGGKLFRFAAGPDDEELRLIICLASDPPVAADEPPKLRLASAPDGSSVVVEAGDTAGAFRVLVILPAGVPAPDDAELVLEIIEKPAGAVPPCRIRVRRTACRIDTALVEGLDEEQSLSDQTRAALLWFGWRRYSQVMALKRFRGSKSGSAVLVFRPGLFGPDTSHPTLKHSGPGRVLDQSWGSHILVKTGEDPKIREEWERFRAFLNDRLHPFMARTEAYLPVQPVNRAPGVPPSSTIIGSFLGGDLVRAEPLEQLIQGAREPAECDAVLDKLFSITATWYAEAEARPLSDWTKMLEIDRASGQVMLFNKYDLSTDAGRQVYKDNLAWDVDFVREDHLSRHLLGRDRDGLLHRLGELEARFSVTHGDLHPRNVLADSANVWLIDFGEAGVAPTLFDFAKLEVYLRLWCLPLSPTVRNFQDAVIAIEERLLDHLIGSEGCLEPIRGLASDIGAAPDQLLKVAHTIACIRRRALAYSLGSPDRRDYLAVLYLTLLKTLIYAGGDTAPVENFRMIAGLTWVVEDTLSRILSPGGPYVRGRIALDPKRLVIREWLAAPGAPQRVAYLIKRKDGQAALAPVAATRGVLQSGRHHLDIYDHTLLVLAYMEALLEDPVGGFLDPGALDWRVAEALQAQGIDLPPVDRDSPIEATDSIVAGLPDDVLDDVRSLLDRLLDDETRLLLKWVVLFHDVGKPGTRSVRRTARGDSAKIQFLGHELYGLRLVADHLDVLFPDSNEDGTTRASDERRRVEQMLRGHHGPHQIVERYLNSPGSLGQVAEGLTSGRLLAGEARFIAARVDPEEAGDGGENFPLLMLHGYADRLACRGPGEVTPLAEVARILLVMLAVFARYGRIKHRQKMEATCKGLTKGYDKELGITGPDLGKVLRALNEWCLEQACAGCPEDQLADPPTQAEMLTRAREIMGDMGLQPEG